MTHMIMPDPPPDPGFDSRLPELREALMSEEGLRQIARLVTIGELALCFSHEVRNPLSAVIGCAHNMQQALPEGDPIRTQLDSIARNGLRLKGMTDSMLNFGRKRDTTKDRCSVEELIQEAVRLAGPYFQDFQCPPIVIQVNVECACPNIAVDHWAMIHVLVNLLNNAADAMAQSRQRLITITAQCEAQRMVRISVADTGSGIPAEAAPSVFNPFFTTKGERGNGLGLFIARKTIEDNGGSITLQTGNNGTVFTICLPTER